MSAPPDTPTSHFIAAPDGLMLHALDHGPGDPARLPVVCLAGLTRTALDFEPLARALRTDTLGTPRRVIALDYRGRGRSARDRDPSRYDILVENADILAVLDALGIARAIFVGTSRGGLHVMVLGATRPRLVAAAVLNDIGPVIEAQGLARIRGYVGQLPTPRSWADATDLCRRLAGAQFPAVPDADWERFARGTFEEAEGALRPRYDPALLDNLTKLDLEVPLPTLWPQFQALAHVPLLAIRGEMSDLFAPATLAEMARRHPACETLTVEGQGHAPLLVDAPTLDAIARFVAAHG